MIKLNTAARERMHDTLGIARAALKSAAPSPSGKRCAGHGGLARLRARSWVAELCSASNPFSPSPFHNRLRRAAGKVGAGFLSPSRARLPQERKRAPKRAMRWVLTNAIRAGSASGSKAAHARCKRPIRTGERALFYPECRSHYCDGDDCGQAASREFSACAFDEENNTSV
jgi:hypothetical protein